MSAIPFSHMIFPALLLFVSQDGSEPTTPAAPRPELPEPSDVIDGAVSAGELYAHVNVLASDEFAGRFTGSPGGQAAAAYLASTLGKLRSHGLQPAGDDFGFLQNVPLSVVSFDRLPRMNLPGGESLALGSEFNLKNGFGFQGELKLLTINDLADVPVEADPGTALFLNVAGSRSRAMLREQSAEWQAGWGALIERGSPKAGRLIDDPARITRVRGPLRPLRLEVRGPGREQLESAQGMLRFEIGGGLNTTSNVVALLPATTPLGDGEVRQAVVLSAHYDHLRAHSVAEGEDGIFNGADDNASGVAAVLETIEALCFSDTPRSRDLIVMLVTGEEIGGAGTSHYLDHPVASLEATVADLNVEMIGRPDEMVGGAGKLWLTGYDYTNLGNSLVERGLPVVEDPRFNQNFFQRSDNYSFVLKGIVGQTLSSYNMHKDYHHASDEADTLDYEHMRLGTEVVIAATALLLSADFEVKWDEGYTLPRR